jgi:predicted phosphodiesterase
MVRVVTLGLTPPRDVPIRIELGERVILVFHGHEPEFSAFEASHAADYVCYGHTHVAADRRMGRVRFINPGALHRARTHTVATLDLVSDDLRFWEVPDQPVGPRGPRRFHPPA